MEPDPDEHQHPGEEELEWANKEIKENKPKGLYSKTSEAARGFISTEKQCSLFCGGKKCRYCSGEGWEPHETVIKGIYSEWVTDNILAMARPSNACIEKHHLVQQFIDADINTIINLQIPGEHADCGPHKLDPSGFLYNPQTFMEKGVFFYNFGWPDYGVASLSTILDMVKVMQFAVSQGKVAVHCHAGRGRTGVIIACYLVFTNRISGREAIHYVREKRPNSIQTRQQMQVIGEFEKYLKPFRTVFASREKDSHEFSLQQYLNRQRHILHGYEARRLKYVPKVIYVVCERLLELAKKGSSLEKQFDKVRPELKQTFSSISEASKKSTATLTPPSVSKSVSKDSLSTFGKKKRFKASLAATRGKFKSISMEDLNNDQFKGVLDNHSADDKGSVASSNSGICMKNVNKSDSEDDNDSICFGSTYDLKAAANGESSKEYNNKPNGVSNNEELSIQTEAGGWSIDESITGQLSEECVHKVAYALSTNEIEDYVKERAANYECQLNETDTAWTALSTEGDPHVLGLLLWDWLDQLKEPVLRAQDLQFLLQYVDTPLTSLQKVEKGTRFTIEYIIKVICKLKPLKEDTLMNIYEKLLSHLTHKWVVYDHVALHQSWAGSTMSSDLGDDKEHWAEMQPQMAEQLFQLFYNLQTELDSKTETSSAGRKTFSAAGSRRR